MKQTIMHLISTSFYGGPEKQISEHLLLIDRYQRYNGVLASFIEGNDENETLARAKSNGIKHCRIPMAHQLDIRALMRLMRTIRLGKIDLLCAHGYKAVVMGCIAARLENIPVLAFSRGYTSENRKVRFYEWLERKFLEKCNGVICVSNGQRKRLASLKVKWKKNWVVHNAVATTESIPARDNDLNGNVKNQLDIPAESLAIVTAGRLSPEKGHQYLLQAIHLLKDRLPNAFYIFCGDGQCINEMKDSAEKLEIQKQCRFIGFRKDLDMIMRCMDIFVLPSLTEGLPNVILESFSMAKPVVATNVGGVPELVAHNKNGLLVPSKRPDLMADAIYELAINPEKRKLMGKMGLFVVKSKFNFSEQNKKLEKIYNEVLLDDTSKSIQCKKPLVGDYFSNLKKQPLNRPKN